MNKLFYVLSLVGLLGCAKTTTIRQDDFVRPKIKHVKKEYRYVLPGWKEIAGVKSSYTVPENWEETSDGKGYKSIASMAKTIFSTDNMNVNMDTYIIKNIAALPNNVKVLKIKKLILNGNEAFMMILAVGPVFITRVSVLHEKIFYNLSCGGSFLFAKLTAPYCQKILSSLEVK